MQHCQPLVERKRFDPAEKHRDAFIGEITLNSVLDHPLNVGGMK